MEWINRPLSVEIYNYIVFCREVRNIVLIAIVSTRTVGFGIPTSISVARPYKCVGWKRLSFAESHLEIVHRAIRSAVTIKFNDIFVRAENWMNLSIIRKWLSWIYRVAIFIFPTGKSVAIFSLLWNVDRLIVVYDFLMLVAFCVRPSDLQTIFECVVGSECKATRLDINCSNRCGDRDSSKSERYNYDSSRASYRSAIARLFAPNNCRDTDNDECCARNNRSDSTNTDNRSVGFCTHNGPPTGVWYE